jgi:hypothetical protein
MPKQNADYWIKHLRLKPHPEGGYYRETYRSPETISRAGLPKRYKGKRSFATAIYFLLKGRQFSAFHRLKSDEIWHFYAGSPMLISSLTKKNKLLRQKLGLNPARRERPQVDIRAGAWFAASLVKQTPGSYALVGCTVAPGFDFTDFEIGNREKLCRDFPRLNGLIRKLTKPEHA